MQKIGRFSIKLCIKVRKLEFFERGIEKFLFRCEKEYIKAHATISP